MQINLCENIVLRNIKIIGFRIYTLCSMSCNCYIVYITMVFMCVSDTLPCWKNIEKNHRIYKIIWNCFIAYEMYFVSVPMNRHCRYINIGIIYCFCTDCTQYSLRVKKRKQPIVYWSNWTIERCKENYICTVLYNKYCM